MVDLGSRRRSPAHTRGGRCGIFYWKAIVPFVLGLILLAGFSQHGSLPLGFLQSSTVARQQLLANCTTADGTSKCNCPQAATVTDGATSTAVLQLANKVSVATVDKVLHAAASDRPAEQIVRVRVISAN